MSIAREKRKELFLTNLKEKKNDEYELVGEFIKVREKTTFRHKVCGYEWETMPYMLLKTKSSGCPRCQYRRKSKTTESYINELKDKTNNEYTLVEGQTYINNRTKLNFRHSKCKTEFTAVPTSVFINDISCPVCRKETPTTRKKTTEVFKKELYDKYKDEYILVEGSEYKSALDKVSICHTACGYEWSVRASHILHTSGCPNCNESKGEKHISEFLQEQCITYKREYIFEDCKNTKYLPFDFAIFTKDSLVGLVEYDGSQHFIPFKHFGGEEKLRRTQFNDKKKNKYCKDNKIPLLRIKYDTEQQDIENKILTFIENHS